MTGRHREVLSELSELGLALARDLQARALAASDTQAACELALAFHRISRSLRQTLALEARLEREQKLALRQAEADHAKQALASIQRRRREVRAALAPLIWTEAEGDEDKAERLFEDLDNRLIDLDPLDEDFVDQPLETCIARIREGLGLPAGKPAPEVVIWRSSA